MAYANETLLSSDPIPFGRWGPLIDPVGAQVITIDGRLRDVVGMYRNETRGQTMLRLQSFDRRVNDECAIGACRMLHRR